MPWSSRQSQCLSSLESILILGCMADPPSHPEQAAVLTSPQKAQLLSPIRTQYPPTGNSFRAQTPPASGQRKRQTPSDHSRTRRSSLARPAPPLPGALYPKSLCFSILAQGFCSTDHSGARQAAQSHHKALRPQQFGSATQAGVPEAEKELTHGQNHNNSNSCHCH